MKKVLFIFCTVFLFSTSIGFGDDSRVYRDELFSISIAFGDRSGIDWSRKNCAELQELYIKLGLNFGQEVKNSPEAAVVDFNGDGRVDGHDLDFFKKVMAAKKCK